MTPDDALAFVRDHHRAVVVTHRASGGVQTSPVMVATDDETVVISSRHTAYKVRNIRRDPRVTICAFTDRFVGDWIQIDGTVQIVELPEAMDALVGYYRRISGEHPDWEEYREAMRSEGRVLLRIELTTAGPDRAG